MNETLPILYRDDYLVAVHKPAGLLVHRSDIDRHETRFAVQIVRRQLGCRAHPLHRLDRGTSGILLFALDRETASRIGPQFESQAVDKTYLAVVRGHPQPEGHIDHPLRRTADDYAGRNRAADEPAQDAVTDYRRLATCELPIAVDRYPTSRYALVELKPQSGRRHQLRRHMKHIAHPIVGDATYGKGRHNRMFQEHFGCHRMLLACVGLSLWHPAADAPLDIRAPLADDFAALVDALGWRAARQAIPGCA